MEKKNSPFPNSEDRISQLPDSLIHHILSFLDTKYAVQTSILSKRWRPLCTSLPTLNFNDYMFRPPKRGSSSGFIRFVDTVLINRGSSDILRFRLNCESLSGKTIITHIYTWINGAVRRNVQEISIKMHFDADFQLPPSLFSSTSLKKLEFDGAEISEYWKLSKLILPTSVNLPGLKYLKLSGLSIAENLSNKFLSNCPALEVLILQTGHVEDSGKNFNISCPNLLRLQINNLHIPQESRVRNVKLYAPKLVFFTCKDSMAMEYDLGSLDCLERAEFETLPNESSLPEDIYARRVVKFLRVVRNVKDLKLSAWFLEGLMKNPKIMENPPIEFNNLQRLVLETILSNDSYRAITYLLKISNFIKSLSLSVVDWKGPQSPFVDEVTYDSGNNLDYRKARFPMPCDFYLKVVEITDLQGCVHELKLLEMLLRRSVILEKVIISRHYSFTKKRLKKFSEMLPTFRRPLAAATTMILFMP